MTELFIYVPLTSSPLIRLHTPYPRYKLLINSTICDAIIINLHKERFFNPTFELTCSIAINSWVECAKMNRLKSFMCSKHCAHCFFFYNEIKSSSSDKDFTLIFSIQLFCFCLVLIFSVAICVRYSYARVRSFYFTVVRSMYVCVALLICFVFIIIINIRRFQVPLCVVYSQFSKSITSIALLDHDSLTHSICLCTFFFLMISRKCDSCAL